MKTPEHDEHEDIEDHEVKNVELLRALRSLRGLRVWALGVGSWELACALTMACALSTACGKKGPPLLPFVRQPKAAEITSARRVGNDVYLTVTVPTANVDDSTPASVAHIQVLAVTAGA